MNLLVGSLLEQVSEDEHVGLAVVLARLSAWLVVGHPDLKTEQHKKNVIRKNISLLIINILLRCNTTYFLADAHAFLGHASDDTGKARKRDRHE